MKISGVDGNVDDHDIASCNALFSVLCHPLRWFALVFNIAIVSPHRLKWYAMLIVTNSNKYQLVDNKCCCHVVRKLHSIFIKNFIHRLLQKVVDLLSRHKRQHCNGQNITINNKKNNAICFYLKCSPFFYQ